MGRDELGDLAGEVLQSGDGPAEVLELLEEGEGGGPVHAVKRAGGQHRRRTSDPFEVLVGPRGALHRAVRYTNRCS